jgi:hypothetical protein
MAFAHTRVCSTCPGQNDPSDRRSSNSRVAVKNQRPATRYDGGKTVRRPESIIERNRIKP